MIARNAVVAGTRWARRARTCSSTRAWCAVAAGAPTSPTSRTSTRWPRRSAACSAAPPLACRGARRRLRLRRRVRRAPVPGRGGPPVGALLDGGHHRRRRSGGQARGLPPARDPRGVHRRHPHPRAVGRHRLAAPAAAPAPAAGAGDDGRDAAQRHAERRVRRGLHPRGRTLGLPRHGVGLHDDERSARPADAASRDGRPRGRPRPASCAPRSTRRRRRPPPPASTPSGATGTTRRCRTSRAPRRSRRSSRPRRPRRRAACEAIAAVADGDAAVDEAVAVIGDRSMLTGLRLRRPAPAGSPSRPTATSSGRAAAPA